MVFWDVTDRVPPYLLLELAGRGEPPKGFFLDQGKAIDAKDCFGKLDFLSEKKSRSVVYLSPPPHSSSEADWEVQERDEGVKARKDGLDMINREWRPYKITSQVLNEVAGHLSGAPPWRSQEQGRRAEPTSNIGRRRFRRAFPVTCDPLTRLDSSLDSNHVYPKGAPSLVAGALKSNLQVELRNPRGTLPLFSLNIRPKLQ
ncbi:hypothetical protein VNO77_14340 [Canavalia gladiata]|uniref:Uncharacterized protein n=1 Tax=Canavalia gladiata TaxID=3824 RepID=A0AAN9LY45_CANGL